MSETNPSLVVTRHGGAEVLEVQDLPRPVPAAGEVLVQVAAAGVNFIDIYLREGIYPGPTPYVLGREGAGTVVSLGPDVQSVSVGQRLCWATARASAASFAVVPVSAAATVPDGVDLHIAAAAMLQGMTAHYLIDSTYPVRSGDWVLIHAAAGGVGQILTQLVLSRGGHPICTVSSAAKAATVTALGCEHVINYAQEADVAGIVRELTGGVGVAAVYDGVGRATFDASLASLRPRGTLALFGAASGPVPPFDIQRLNAGGSLFLSRPSLGDYLSSPEEFHYRSQAILQAIAANQLKIEIGGRYPLSSAAQAYRDLESRRTTGKLLLIP